MNGYMSLNHLDDGSFCGDRSYEELEMDGFREDPGVFREQDTLYAGLRGMCNQFYSGLSL